MTIGDFFQNMDRDNVDKRYHGVVDVYFMHAARTPRNVILKWESHPIRTVPAVGQVFEVPDGAGATHRWRVTAEEWMIDPAVTLTVEDAPVGTATQVTPIKYQVSAFPPDDDRARHFSVYIEMRRPGSFAVVDGFSPAKYVDADGVWAYPSAADDVPARFWHDQATAERLAHAAATVKAGEWAEMDRARAGRKDPKDMTRPELIAECRRLYITPKGGLTRATRPALENWVRINRPRGDRS